jgi:hypothetical protein
MMAKEEVPASQLKLRSMLDEDKTQYNDCLACRVVGMTFLLPPKESKISSPDENQERPSLWLRVLTPIYPA